jgi:hypothetical protein
VTPSTPWTPAALRLRRWRRIAALEVEAAEMAGEEHIAQAFRLVVLAIDLDAAPEPIQNGYGENFMGRRAIRERARQLGRMGASSREVARLLGIPAVTAYTWLKKDGLAKPRQQWLDEDAVPSMRPAQAASPNGRKHADGLG